MTGKRAFLLKSQKPWKQGVYYSCPDSLSPNTWNFIYRQTTSAIPLQITDLDAVVNFHRPHIRKPPPPPPEHDVDERYGIFYNKDDYEP
jgi:hypothetical protein